jgi:hypothetical protein
MKEDRPFATGFALGGWHLADGTWRMAIVGSSFLSLTEYNGKGRQTRRDLHLNIDRPRLDPFKGDS